MELSQDEAELCSQDAAKYINETVKAILILDQSKKPFKQVDISKYLSKKLNRKSWLIVMEHSQRKLKEMGLNLIEIDTKSYILTSSIFPLDCMYKSASKSEVADRTLLILILTYIFMKEGTVSKDDIFNHLQQLNIYSDAEPVHKYFGDVKKKVTNDFVKQKYLEVVNKKESDSETIKWGPRALAEVSKKSILEFVCNVGYGGSIQPKNLASQYQEVVEEEEKMIVEV